MRHTLVITQASPYLGALEDGRQLFGMFTGQFKSEQFVECLDVVRRKFGRVAVLWDRWSVHMSNEVKEYLREHRDVKIINISKGSPYLNVTEACWNHGKCDLGSAIYDTDTPERVRILQNDCVCVS